MDNGRLESLHSSFVIAGAVLSSLASLALSLVGVAMGEFRADLPVFIFLIWAIIWGAFCGGVAAYRAVKILLSEPYPVYGVLWGIAAGFLIGLVNGLFTKKATGGAILGIIVGAILGLILAKRFLKIINPK